MRRAWLFGRFVITSTIQPAGAPIFDRAYSTTQIGTRAQGWAIHLTPWRKDRYRDRRPGLALVVAWLKR